MAVHKLIVTKRNLPTCACQSLVFHEILEHARTTQAQTITPFRLPVLICLHTLREILHNAYTYETLLAGKEDTFVQCLFLSIPWRANLVDLCSYAEFFVALCHVLCMCLLTRLLVSCHIVL